MLATILNACLILIGSAIGLAFKHLISKELLSILTQALGLCVLGLGVSNVIGTQNMLCVIICMVLGAILGHILGLERRLEKAGHLLRVKLVKGKAGNRFTDGFVHATLLFCVGAMAITGSLEAGLHHNYEVLISKGIIDGVTSISFAATMGSGVAFAVLPLLLYQGGITWLATWMEPYLSTAVVTEMSALGGLLIAAIAINMLELGKHKIRVGDMLPGIFLPIIYMPLADCLKTALFQSF